MPDADTTSLRAADSRQPGLVARGLGVRYPGSSRGVLSEVMLEVKSGEVVCLRGRSGSGKTTLLKAANGLIPWLEPADVTGHIDLDGAPLDDLDPGQRAPLLGSCLDRPDSQLFLTTPRHELAAAARMHGGAPLDGLIERLDITGLLDRRTTTLSSGERQRVALAVALSAAPRPLLLDEPTAHLDHLGTLAVAATLSEVASTGGSALVADHAGWRLQPGIDRWLQLRAARLDDAAAPVALRLPPPSHSCGDATVLSARGLVLERGGRRLTGPLDIELRQGEIVVLSGPNGVGKTTLARALAGGDRRAVVHSGRVGLMLPDAMLQLFGRTVLGELEALSPDHDAIARVLRRHRLEQLSARPPWALSRGERQRLVHAALDLTRPALLIVDEPTQGLDPEDLAAFVDLVQRRAAKGRSYLLISHREELLSVGHRRLHLEDGRLEEVGR